MISEILKVVDLGFEYWIKKNYDYGVYDEIFNDRVWSWCLKVWDKYNLDPRYSLGFVLFRIDRGEGFKIHRDKGSGKMVMIVVLEGEMDLIYEDQIIRVKNFYQFEGNKLHGAGKGCRCKYLVLFSKKLR